MRRSRRRDCEGFGIGVEVAGRDFTNSLGSDVLPARSCAQGIPGRSDSRSSGEERSEASATVRVERSVELAQVRLDSLGEQCERLLVGHLEAGLGHQVSQDRQSRG